jgi:hypothetical protein
MSSLLIGKKFKQVTLTVITQHVGDTDSEDETPPPPPPGSPPRSVLIVRFSSRSIAILGF